ncbi:MAG TPA: restriction endonuclease [Candidatus Coprenecus pullistercoris]|nr:restriction endonuclease [Candidatus Coprenecus pullistercoris]
MWAWTLLIPVVIFFSCIGIANLLNNREEKRLRKNRAEQEKAYEEFCDKQQNEVSNEAMETKNKVTEERLSGENSDIKITYLIDNSVYPPIHIAHIEDAQIHYYRPIRRIKVIRNVNLDYVLKTAENIVKEWDNEDKQHKIISNMQDLSEMWGDNIKVQYSWNIVDDCRKGIHLTEYSALISDKFIWEYRPSRRYRAVHSFDLNELNNMIKDIVAELNNEDERLKQEFNEQKRQEQEELRIAREAAEKFNRALKLPSLIENNEILRNVHLGLNTANTNNMTIQDYCESLLLKSDYLLKWDKQVDSSIQNDTLILDFRFPSVDDFPTMYESRIVRNKEKIVEIGEKKTYQLYDSLLYQITLRCLHDIFGDMNLTHINHCVFNGWVEFMDRAVGKKKSNYVISISANRKDVQDIDFSEVIPKMCFKRLKGISCVELYTATPIQPIVNLNKNDNRFVQNDYNMDEKIDDSTNLAAMPWQDFEYLIRELFEREFSGNGGEVKVTQASRDGGVDAVAFDPDPIRGGKIVIQAKRYTNVVPVSAVRDLYGTVINEGANSGILVTTSDFGSDSYEFIKGKPLKLMNGSNLLYLMEKHGKHARIDIKEAKQINEQ